VNTPIGITLSDVEMQMAIFVGAARHIANAKDGIEHAYGGDPEKGWSMDIEGAAGEIAVARWTGIFWNGNIGNKRADDVGNLQVRTTCWHNGHLLLHKPDKGDKAFVLVTGFAPNLIIRGWLWGYEGKREDLWRELPGRQRPAFCVPQSSLYPMSSLDFVAARKRP
jgi:hypothetical protein